MFDKGGYCRSCSPASRPELSSGLSHMCSGPADLPLPLKMLFPPLKEGSPFRERRLAVP